MSSRARTAVCRPPWPLRTDPTAPACATPANATAYAHLPGEAGVWVFIFGDMIAFGVMFGSYMHEHHRATASFNAAQHELAIPIGTANTVLLLTGSLFVAIGVRGARTGSTRARWLFGLGFACGIGFVINKVVEFGGMVTSGVTPASGAFFAYFFLMTGVHLLHVLGGLIVLGYLTALARRPALGVKQIRRVENGASYWHLVDVLWIVLFPLLYLAH